MISNNVKSVIIHFIVTFILLFIFAVKGNWQRDDRILDIFIFIIASIVYMLLGGLFLDSNVKHPFLSVSFIGTILLLVIGTILVTNSYETLVLYTIMNPIGSSLITDFFNIDTKQYAYCFLITASIPSLLIYIGIKCFNKKQKSI